jgi:hypothetical protein
MRYCVVGLLLALAGCGSLEIYEGARSAPEAFYFIKKGSNLMSDKDVGKNPYDFDPDYRMVYCARGGMQYWSTEATCVAEKGKPQG